MADSSSSASLVARHWKPAAFIAASTAFAAAQWVKSQRQRKADEAEALRQLEELKPLRVKLDHAWQELQEEDLRYIAMTQELLRTRERPIHSDFLVAATISYFKKDWSTNFVQGVNSETCVLTNSLCAERTALFQLRLRNDARNIRSVFITTTAEDALITPGLLCREAMCEFGPPETRIILFTGDFEPRIHPLTNRPTAAFKPLKGQLQIAQLGQLYPHPPLYHNVKRPALLPLAACYASTMQLLDRASLERSPFASIRGLKVSGSLAAQMAGKLLSSGGGGGGLTSPRSSSFYPVSPLAPMAARSEESDAPLSPEAAPADLGLRVLEDRVIALYRATQAVAAGGPVAVGTDDGGVDGGPIGRTSDTLYPIHTAAGVLFSDGSIAMAREDAALEYGCSVDPIHKLLPFIEVKARVQQAALSSAPALAPPPQTPGIGGGGGSSGAADDASSAAASSVAATPTKFPAPGSALRSSRRLSSDSSMTYSALLAPLPFATNGANACSCCGGASHIKPVAATSPPPAVLPSLFLVCDQFGILRAPHASGRAILSEFGWGGASILVHAPPSEFELQALKAAGLPTARKPLTPPSSSADSTLTAGSGAQSPLQQQQPPPYSLILKRLELKNLAPGAPKIVL